MKKTFSRKFTVFFRNNYKVENPEKTRGFLLDDVDGSKYQLTSTGLLFRFCCGIRLNHYHHQQCSRQHHLASTPPFKIFDAQRSVMCALLRRHLNKNQNYAQLDVRNRALFRLKKKTEFLY